MARSIYIATGEELRKLEGVHMLINMLIVSGYLNATVPLSAEDNRLVDCWD